MTSIGIIIGSARPVRLGEQVAAWVHDEAARREDAKFEIVDVRDYALPTLDEPLPAMMGQYQHDHTKAWSEKVASFDGYILITPEYNQSLPASLKNALDFLYAEWRNKAAGIVSYGVAGGLTSAGQLRQLCGVLGMADIPGQVSATLHQDFENMSVFKPRDSVRDALEKLLTDIVAWTTALAPLRTGS